MKKSIQFLIILTLVLISFESKGQTYEEPPKMAMVSNENKPLVDKIIEITEYENYFNNYCLNIIKETEKKEKWTKEKSNSVRSKINFSKFKVLKIYNWLASYSTKELKELIELYEKDNKKKKKNIIVDNANIKQHLEWYVQELIKN